MNKKAIIFSSGQSWEQHAGKGYRTRQGALLKTLVNSNRYDDVFVTVLTGFRGQADIRETHIDGLKTRIINIWVPGRLPEPLLRPFGYDGLRRNYIFPSQALKRIRETKVELIWGYSAGMGTYLREATSAPFYYYSVSQYRSLIRY